MAFKRLFQKLMHRKSPMLLEEPILPPLGEEDADDFEVPLDTPDSKLWEMFDILRVRSGNHTVPVTWNFKDSDGNIREFQLKAKILSLADWERAVQLQDEIVGNTEGYRYYFDAEPELRCIEMPRCECETISETLTVRDNRIDVNLDTYGTRMGIRAEGLYAVYLEEWQRFALVRESYWCW